MGFDVEKYIRERGGETKRPANYYRKLHDALTQNAERFYETYGNNEYNRYLNYLTTKANMEQFGINQDDIAPGYARVDDLIENRKEYEEMYGKSGYNALWSQVNKFTETDRDNIKDAIKMKQAGLFSADILGLSEGLASQFDYTDEADDVMRQKLGYVPKAFDSKANDIVADAKKLLAQYMEKQKVLPPDVEKVAQEVMGAPDVPDWSKYRTVPITEKQLIASIQIMDKLQRGEGLRHETYYPGSRGSLLALEGIPLETPGGERTWVSSEATEQATEQQDAAAAQPPAEQQQRIQQARDEFKDYVSKERESQLDTAKSGIVSMDDIMMSGRGKPLGDNFDFADYTQYDPETGYIITHTVDPKHSYVSGEAARAVADNLNTQIAQLRLKKARGEEVTDAEMKDLKDKGLDEVIAVIMNTKPGDTVLVMDKSLYPVQQDISDTKQAEAYYGDMAFQNMGIAAAVNADPNKNTLTDSVKDIEDFSGDNRRKIIAVLNTVKPDMSEEKAKEIINLGMIDASRYMFATEEQADILRYLYASGDMETFDAYAQTISAELNAKRVQLYQQRTEAEFDKMGGWGKILAAFSSVVHKAAAPIAFGETLVNAARGVPTDPYSTAQMPAVIGAQTQEYTTRDMTPTAKFFADIGFSIADFAPKAALGPTGAAAWLALEAGGQASNEALQMGMSSGQAFARGLAAGAIEYGTERLALDNLFKIGGIIAATAKTSGKKLTKEVVLTGLIEWFKQGGIEGAEELIAEIGGNIADIIIMRDKSPFHQYRQELIDKGMSEQDADWQATVKFFGEDVALASAAGTLSGLAVGAGPVTVNTLQQTQATAAPQESAPVTEGIQSPLAVTAPQTGEQAAAQAVESGKRTPISEGMTDAERYDALKDVTLNVAVHDSKASRLTQEDVAKLERSTRREARRYVRQLYEKFGVAGSYANDATSIEFEFSGRGFSKSLHEQTARAGNYADFGKMLASFENIVRNAQPLELHTDKYTGTLRADANLERVYVLVSAYKDNGIVPVQIEIKEFSDKENQLYVAVTLNKIEADVRATENGQDGTPADALSASTINIRELFEKINPADAQFLRYLPDGFLNSEQKAAKKAALEKEQEKITKLRQESDQPVNMSDTVQTLNEKILHQDRKNSKARETFKKAFNIKTQVDAQFFKALEEMNAQYQTTDNVTQKRIAREFVDSNFEKAERYVKDSMVLQTAADIAIVDELVRRYRETGRADEAQEMLFQAFRKGSAAGQIVQSMAIWAQMTPAGTVKAVQQAIDKANKKLLKGQQYKLSTEQASWLMDTTEKMHAVDARGLADLFIEISQQRGINLNATSRAVLDGFVESNDTAMLLDITHQNMMFNILDNVSRTLGQKISTVQAFSHLINPATALRNVLSNTVFRFQELYSDYFAVTFDALASLITGKRTVALPSLRPSDTKRNVQYGKELAKRSVLEVQTGVNMEGRGKYDLFRTQTFTKRGVRRFLEHTLGYELRTPDQYQKGAIEISEIVKQLRLQGKSVEGKSIQEIFEMADNSTRMLAKEQALYGTFQNDGFIAKRLTELKTLLNKIGINRGDMGLGDLMIKYTTVPGNLIQRSIDYSPAGVLKLFSLIWNGKNLTAAQKQRCVSKTLGRAASGMTLYYVSYLLAKLGVIIGTPDDDKREKKHFEGVGLSGRKLNLSAVERIIKGESPEIQDGDSLISMDFLETVNVPIALGYEWAKWDEQKLDAGTAVNGLGNAFLEEITDLPTMQIVQSMVYEGMYGESGLEVIAVPFKEALPGFIPAPIRRAAYASDPIRRDAKTYGERLQQNIPILRESLPAKLDTFGRPQEQDTGVWAFFNPGRSSTYSPYKFTKELKRLADKYKDNEIYPSGITVKEFNLDKINYRLTDQEQHKFMQTYGEMLADLYDMILASSLSDEEKIEKLKAAQTKAKDVVKAHYANTHPKQGG